MSREDVEQYIEEQLEGPAELSAEDLEPLECCWCGDELDMSSDDISVWEIEHEDGIAAFRYHYCSDECQNEDRTELALGNDPHPHGRAVEVGLDE